MTTAPRLPDLTLNAAADLSVRQMGSEQQPLLIIDGILSNPDDLKRYAVECGEFAAPHHGSYYPGRNGRLPAEYGVALIRALRPLLAAIFGLSADSRMQYDGFFGIATARADALNALQSIPHFDSTHRTKVAGVHYLCNPPYKGTAFYRHRATGFETIDLPRAAIYQKQVERELSEPDAPMGHVTLDTAFYENIDYVEAAFNRLIVYRASSLHAGILQDGMGSGPEDGRLTANSFIEALDMKPHGGVPPV